MRIKEHDCVVLTKNLPEESLEAGDLGTVVHKKPGQGPLAIEPLSDRFCAR
jgi:hypothetical protein